MQKITWLTAPLLEKVMREAKSRGAGVFKISSFTKGDKFKSLVFTVLSARTKDETTLAACKRLFSKYKGVRELANAEPKDVEKLLYGVGFFTVKSKHIIALSRRLLADFNGRVPADFEALLSLPGVGRKTANVVLAHAFGLPAIGVDVHVHRISNRLGIVRTKKPEDTERKLVQIVPESLQPVFNIALVSHGQTTCLPRTPFCSRCVLYEYCRRAGVGKSL